VSPPEREDEYLWANDDPAGPFDLKLPRLLRGLLNAGALTPDELDAHAEALRTGTIDVATPIMISAWGRKP
jgi:hypothetical protein